MVAKVTAAGREGGQLKLHQVGQILHALRQELFAIAFNHLQFTDM